MARLSLALIALLAGWAAPALSDPLEPSPPLLTSPDSVAQVGPEGLLIVLDPALSQPHPVIAAEWDGRSLRVSQQEALQWLSLPDVEVSSADWQAITLYWAEQSSQALWVWVDPEARVLGPVRPGQTLWQFGRQAAEWGPERSAAEWVAALHANNPFAFEQGDRHRLRQAALLRLQPPPPWAPPQSTPNPEPVPELGPSAEPETSLATEALEIRLPSEPPLTPILTPQVMAWSVAAFALMLLSCLLWRRRRRPSSASLASELPMRLAQHFDQQGHSALARGWWAEALLISADEATRQRLRNQLKAEHERA